MVQRCSNGVPFVVITPDAALRTGIHVEIYDGADPSTLIDIVPDTFNRRWLDELVGTGTGSFEVAADNPRILANPTILAYGNVVRFKLDRITRFAFQIEGVRRTQVTTKGGHTRVLEVRGRGVLSKLEEAIAYPQIDGNPVRGFPGITPGHLLEVLLDEALARGAIAGVTYDFDDVVDSNNAPWSADLNETERAGTDLLRIADRIGAVAADVYMTPTLTLQVFNTRGIDRTIATPTQAALELIPGPNIVELVRDEDGAIRNALLIETATGFEERTDAPSIATYRRREAYLSLGNTDSTDYVDRVSDAVFQRSAAPAADITLEVADVDGTRPYLDWGIGDWIFAPDAAGDRTRYRVRAISVTETDDGRPIFVPELATVTEELELRLERWLSAMARGTMGGTAAQVAEPVQTTPETEAAVSSGVSEGISAHNVAANHPDNLGDLGDVSTVGADPNDVLATADGVSWAPIPLPAGATTLDDLTDVDTTTTPPTDTQALLYDAGAGLWKPGDVAAGGGGGGVFSGARVGKTGTQAIPATTATTVSFDSEEFDTDGYHDNVTNNNRLTVPEDGYYMLSFAGAMSGGSTNGFVYLRKNGTTIGHGNYTNGSGYSPVFTSTVGPIFMAAGDYFDAQLYLDAARTLAATATLSVVKLEGAGGGGGGGGPSYGGRFIVGTPHADSVLWDGTDVAAGSVVTVSGSQTFNEPGDNTLSVYFTGQSGNQYNALLFPRTIAIGDEWMIPILSAIGTGYWIHGLCFADGAASGSNAMQLHWQTLSTLYTRIGTFAAAGGPSGVGVGFGRTDPHFLKLRYTAANSFACQVGVDGETWLTPSGSPVADTLTPTHVGIVWSTEGSGPGMFRVGPLQKIV